MESLELCPDFDGLEKFVAENEFEVVFLKPNEVIFWRKLEKNAPNSEIPPKKNP